MSEGFDHLYRSGVLGRSAAQTARGEPLNQQEKLVFGAHATRCPFTGRVYENGSGARSQQEQTERFIAEQAAENDRALPGDVCPYSGQPLDASIGALPRSIQIENFFAALPEETKLGWFKRAEALAATVTQGNA
jgi:hypothetical protein